MENWGVKECFVLEDSMNFSEKKEWSDTQYKVITPHAAKMEIRGDYKKYKKVLLP